MNSRNNWPTDLEQIELMEGEHRTQRAANVRASFLHLHDLATAHPEMARATGADEFVRVWRDNAARKKRELVARNDRLKLEREATLESVRVKAISNLQRRDRDADAASFHGVVMEAVPEPEPTPEPTTTTEPAPIRPKRRRKPRRGLDRPG